MHELPFTENLYKMAVREGERAGAEKIISITLSMGEGCDYVPEIIQEYFDMMSEGSIAEGAQIRAHIIPAQIRCISCGHRFGRTEQGEIPDCCPKCGGRQLRPDLNASCYIENMEIES